MSQYLDKEGLQYLWGKIKERFVASETGKGLSTNDFTTAEKEKLEGIAAGANKTTVVNSLTSTSTANALSAAQGKALNDKISAINVSMENLGAGDMLKSVYDTDGDGVIDTAENAMQLNGQDSDYYAKASDIVGIHNAETHSEIFNDYTGNAAGGNYSHVEGKNSATALDVSHAEGNNMTALGEFAHAEGYSSVSVHENYPDWTRETNDDTVLTQWEQQKFGLAKGSPSHTEGENCLALGNNSHAEGIQTIAKWQSHAEGAYTKALGNNSHAEGNRTQATGAHSHSECDETVAGGQASHAEGFQTKAMGSFSHAEGYINVIEEGGESSHAEGARNTVRGKMSHAEGYGNSVSGYYSHAEGYGNTVNHDYCHVGGKSNVSYLNHQTIFGLYADSNRDAYFMIGNGGESSRKNAFEVRVDGSARVQTQGTTGDSVVIKSYVDNAISKAIAEADNIKRTIVEALPETADGNVIYMVLEDGDSSNNKYVEWMFINGVWEKIGDTDIDLTGYLKTDDVNVISNSEIDTILAS